MRKFWMMLATVALIVAGCGGDDSDDTASEDTSSDDTSADVSDDNGDSGDDNGDSGDSGDSGDDNGDSSGDAGAFVNNSNCDFVLEGDLNPLADDFDTDQSADELANQVQDIADAAPDEISDDMQLFADKYGEFIDIVGDIDMSDPEAFEDPDVQQAFTEAQGIFQDPEFQDASQRINTYFQENCSS